MIRPTLALALVLSLAAAASASAAAADAPTLEKAMKEAMKAAADKASAPRAQVVKVDRCWTRLPALAPRHEPVYEAAKVPQEFCLRDLTVAVGPEKGAAVVDGAVKPAGAKERSAASVEAHELTGIKASEDSRLFSGLVYEVENAHHDRGLVRLKFRVDAEGKVVPSSVWLDFDVSCPDQLCAAGEEPSVSVSASSWR